MKTKKVLSLILVLALCASLLQLNVLASTTPVPTTENGSLNFSIAKQTELESILLLQNNARSTGGLMLPLSKEADKVAVFGNGQRAPINGSSGSGTVAGAFTYTLIEGLKEFGASYDTTLAAYYDSKGTTHGWDNSDKSKWGVSQYSGTGWNRGSPIAAPELKLDDGLVTPNGLIGGAKTGGANVAVVYLQRNVGTEEMDRASGPPQPSDWYLNPSEKTLLKQVTDKFDDVVLVVNTAGAIDMTFLSFDWLANDPDYNDGGAITQAQAAQRASKIRSIVWMYGAASYHGLVLAELMYGKENFSAKLADTITYEWGDHFTSATFGGSQTYGENGAKNGFGNNGASYGTRWGANDPVTVYNEFIYSGYRYFDTFCGDKAGKADDPVKYPFGFGKSYSDFTFSDYNVIWNAETQAFTVSAMITNTTDSAALPSGKEVLEVYLSAPNTGKLDQPYQILVGYNKTQKLAKGESQRVSADIPVYYMASYDEATASYIMEPGDFIFRAGNSSRNTRIAGIVTVPEKITVQELSNKLTLNEADPAGKADNQSEFDAIRLNSQKTSKPLVNSNDASDKLSCVKGSLAKDAVVKIASPGLEAFIPGTAPSDAAYTLQSVVNGDVKTEDFVAQLTKDELAALLSGGTGTTSAVGGNPFRYYSDDKNVPLVDVHSKPTESNVRVGGAGTSRNIQRLGIPSVTYADGGAGISISAAIATNLGIDRNAGYNRSAGAACTWNPDLQYAWGQAIGRDMRNINVDIWLAPSINLHRNPLNGRNTEYYSEDPMLSGLASSYISRGVASQGVTVCLKHFAGNDQEQYRRGLYTPASVTAGTSKDAINTVNSERGLREITLRAFELPVKTGAVRCVMSAFNKMNGQECAASSDLLIDILRAEWGFKGYVVTDWGDYDDIAHAANEMRSGNDMIMSGRHTRYSIPDQLYYGIVDEYAKDEHGNAIVGGRDDGLVSMADMRRNAANVIYTIMGSKNAFDGGKYNLGLINPAKTVQYHAKRSLAILSTSLPSGIELVSYSTQKTNPLLATGSEGTAFYRFSISEGALPVGLSLLGNGSIVGTPASRSGGSYPITFKVEDSFGNSATKALTLKIEPAVIIAELPNPRIGLEYSYQIKAVGGVAPDVFSLDTVKGDALPTGLTLDPATGVISGTPSSREEIGRSFRLVINYQDSLGKFVSTSASIKLLDYIDITFSASSPMLVAKGQSIGYITIEASRSLGDTFTYEVTGLPAGLVAADYGFYLIAGSVSESAEAKTYTANVKASLVGTSISVNVPFVFTVYDASGEFDFVTGAMLPDAKANVPYSTSVFASGTGTKRYAFDASSDRPNGLTLNANSGAIAWTPGASDFGYHKLVINATMGTASIQGTFWLYVDAGISITEPTRNYVDVPVGKSIRQQFTAKGYSTSVEFSVSNKGSALPKGVTLGSDGLLSGTPEEEGLYMIIVRADEIGGALSGAMKMFYIEVLPEGTPVITNWKLDASTIVSGYAANIPVEVEGWNLEGTEISLVADTVGNSPKIGSAIIHNGKALLRLTKEQVPEVKEWTTYLIAFSKNDTTYDSIPFAVAPRNDDIWKVSLEPQENGTIIRFNADIALNTSKFDVKVNGASTTAVQNGNDIVCQHKPQNGDTFVISGIKYPTLFPSYSFTFTARYTIA